MRSAHQIDGTNVVSTSNGWDQCGQQIRWMGLMRSAYQMDGTNAVSTSDGWDQCGQHIRWMGLPSEPDQAFHDGFERFGGASRRYR